MPYLPTLVVTEAEPISDPLQFLRGFPCEVCTTGQRVSEWLTGTGFVLAAAEGQVGRASRPQRTFLPLSTSVHLSQEGTVTCSRSPA